MPNLKDLKNRIESVKNTRKITKAMQMVAAAKLRRAQEAAEAGRPYAERFNTVLGSLAAASAGGNAPMLLSGTGSDKVHMLVVMTAERGLCGGFNSSIVKMARAKADELLGQGKTVKMITVGKKGREQLKREFGDIMVHHVDLSEVRNVSYGNAQGIANDLIHRFNEGEFDVATIFYNTFESVISQVPTTTQVIPASFDAPEEGADASVVYDYEPSEEGILKTLLPSGVATQIFSALLENAASEQGARMSAMDNATRNAGDMIDKLTIQFNRSRQAVITNELIEIISGAEAL
ncbi:F0F1 ATP synthase subunit gamma [Aliiroseovarius sp. KMU-50]|uniref:ATP synthase gamma chain n=1 Tax=Aliiroseovarius salicola TaxID=3009082 RepID=A0ABT4W409_9RHOB|nr:F0F1 ATP synthase subunit gamma [Aliiroseovarius sp. KMU-50]MDA5095210.1 F0F1 ATP synthase subunit gamma [Aliiroseovarius sp. KMU-50]